MSMPPPNDTLTSAATRIGCKESNLLRFKINVQSTERDIGTNENRGRMKVIAWSPAELTPGHNASQVRLGTVLNGSKHI